MSNGPKLVSPMALERTFLHDIASPLTVIKAMGKKIKTAVEQDRRSDTPNDTLKHVERLMRAIEQLETLHADHKAVLFEIEESLARSAG